MSQKWTSTAGPRQTKTVNKALGDLSWAGKGRVQLDGIHGQPETERRHVITALCTGTASELCIAKLNEIGERYGWAVTRENHSRIVADCAAATVEVEADRPVDDLRITAEEAAARAAASADRNQREGERHRAEVACHEKLVAKMPTWARALIVAELIEDDSDSMTDYFHSKTMRTVAIGWRSGEREDFRQLRQAAATFPETAHLGPGCDRVRVCAVYASDDSDTGRQKGQYYTLAPIHGEHFTTQAEALAAIAAAEPIGPAHEYKLECEGLEHRENWSMGAGNYLKSGGRHNSGWKVSSMSLPIRHWSGIIEDHLPEVSAPRASTDRAIPEGSAPPVPSVSAVTVTENEDKDGIELRFPDKPAADVLDSLKSHGWRWAKFSRCWYHKRTPDAREFANRLAGVTAAEVAA
jgi:hypothetical protein